MKSRSLEIKKKGTIVFKNSHLQLYSLRFCSSSPQLVLQCLFGKGIFKIICSKTEEGERSQVPWSPLWAVFVALKSGGSKPWLGTCLKSVRRTLAVSLIRKLSEKTFGKNLHWDLIMAKPHNQTLHSLWERKRRIKTCMPQYLLVKEEAWAWVKPNYACKMQRESPQRATWCLFSLPLLGVA